MISALGRIWKKITSHVIILTLKEANKRNKKILKYPSEVFIISFWIIQQNTTYENE